MKKKKKKSKFVVQSMGRVTKPGGKAPLKPAVQNVIVALPHYSHNRLSLRNGRRYSAQRDDSQGRVEAK